MKELLDLVKDFCTDNYIWIIAALLGLILILVVIRIVKNGGKDTKNKDTKDTDENTDLGRKDYFLEGEYDAMVKNAALSASDKKNKEAEQAFNEEEHAAKSSTRDYTEIAEDIQRHETLIPEESRYEEVPDGYDIKASDAVKAEFEALVKNPQTIADVIPHIDKTVVFSKESFDNETERWVVSEIDKDRVEAPFNCDDVMDEAEKQVDLEVIGNKSGEEFQSVQININIRRGQVKIDYEEDGNITCMVETQQEENNVGEEHAAKEVVEDSSDDSIADQGVVLEKINLVKVAPVKKFGPDNFNTSRSGRTFTEEELREQIKQ